MTMETNWINKWAGIALAALLMAGCASTDTMDSDDGMDSGMADTMETADSGMTDSMGMEDDMAELQTVFHFDFDKATLRPDVRAALDRQAERLRDSDTRIRLEGHADERGTREYNLALGERRAKSVANYLVVQGVDRSRIQIISYGEEKPVAFGSNEEAWQKNRRVELIDR